MNNNDEFSGNRNQVTLSYNLLCLLRWLAQCERSKLKKIISHALKDGLQQELHMISMSHNDQELIQDLHHGVIDLFELLESLLIESVKEQAVEKAKEKKLMPTIEQIDTTICDSALVQNSIEKTTEKMESNPDLNAQEQLFKELLKQWRPHDRNIIN